MASWRWWTVLVLSVGVAAYALVLYGVLIPLGVPPPAVPLPTASYTVALYLHIAGGIVALATGPFQFSVRLRRRNVRLHRALGLAYLAGIALGGVAGLVAAFLSPTFLIAKVGFGGLALAWLVTGSFAYRTAIARRFQVHRAWVYRSFALTLAAVTLRIELPLLAIAYRGFDPAYMTVAWLCWVPNIVVAEWLIRTRRGLLDATPGEAPAAA